MNITSFPWYSRQLLVRLTKCEFRYFNVCFFLTTTKKDNTKTLRALLDHKFLVLKETVLFVFVLSFGNNLEPCMKQMFKEDLLNT